MRLLLLAVVALTTACTGLPLPGTGTACTEEARAGINLTVKNATTGADICDATAVITEGGYSETLQAFSCTYAGAYERAGTYTIQVSRTGFTTETISGVVVAEDECHVIPINRTVELTPQ